MLSHAIACIECGDAPVDHRLAAATSAMAAAYAESDPDTALKVAVAAAGIEPRTDADRLHVLRTRLIYEYEFGDVSRAVEIGDKYLELFRRANNGRLSQALRVSSFPHRIAGNFGIVRDRLEEALRTAEREAHRQDQARALEYLSHLSADEADYPEAAKNLDRLLGILERCPPAVDVPMRVSIASIALMLGRSALAASQLAYADTTLLPLHGRCEVLATRVLAAAMQGTRCDDHDLSDLFRLNEQLRSRPGQESAVLGIAAALNQRSRTIEAVAVVTRYANEYRREPWPSRHPIIRSFIDGRPHVAAIPVSTPPACPE